MLRMLGSVNDHLDKLEPSGDQRVNMWCHTCHAGRPRPMTLSEELAETYRTRGADDALAHYSMLGEKFYGKGAYDFTVDGDARGAVRIFELNSKSFPESICPSS